MFVGQKQNSMKRQNLFRGKHKGQWVYGSLICCTNFEGQTFYQIDNGKMNDHQVWDVEPETIGQFTGLLDSNVKKIFDGDCVDFTFFTYHEYEVEETKKGVIWFNGTAFYFVEKANEGDIHYLLDNLTFDSKSDIKVTGNIHDK